MSARRPRLPTARSSAPRSSAPARRTGWRRRRPRSPPPPPLPGRRLDDEGVLFPGVFTTRGTGRGKIPRSPYKVLDAPALQDYFYLNLVDWSLHNILAVGLGNCVYLWNSCSSKVTKLCDLGVDDNVSSVGWAQRGTHLVVGTNQGKVQLVIALLEFMGSCLAELSLLDYGCLRFGCCLSGVCC